jgi:creatinine amidohydrolase
MIRLAERTTREARSLARDRRSVILLPLGAIEQHGPHLPLHVDWLGAEEIARRLGPALAPAGYRPVLAPGLPYGVSTLAEDWSGTVSLSRGTFSRLIVEIVSALADHGFLRFILTNYQADPDHLAAIARARATLGQRRRVQVLVAGFQPGVPRPSPMVNDRVLARLRSPRPEQEWHAGELETSVMLSIAPRLVRRAKAAGLAPVWVDVHGALRRGARRFRDIAPRGGGYFGWPAAARAETGRRVMALRTRLMAQELVAALDAWPRRFGGPKH